MKCQIDQFSHHGAIEHGRVGIREEEEVQHEQERERAVRFLSMRLPWLALGLLLSGIEAEERFLSFELDSGGWNNVRTGVETAAVIAAAFLQHGVRLRLAGGNA